MVKTNNIVASHITPNTLFHFFFSFFKCIPFFFYFLLAFSLGTKRENMIFIFNYAFLFYNTKRDINDITNY